MKKKKLNTLTKKALEMAKSMLKRDIEIVDIMEITGLTEAEILRLQDEALTV